MNYSQQTAEQGKEFFQKLLPMLDIQKITQSLASLKETTSLGSSNNYVAKNLTRVFGVNPAQNIEALKQAREVKELLPQTLEDIMKNPAEHNQKDWDHLVATSQQQNLSQN